MVAIACCFHKAQQVFYQQLIAAGASPSAPCVCCSTIALPLVRFSARTLQNTSGSGSNSRSKRFRGGFRPGRYRQEVLVTRRIIMASLRQAALCVTALQHTMLHADPCTASISKSDVHAAWANHACNNHVRRRMSKTATALLLIPPDLRAASSAASKMAAQAVYANHECQTLLTLPQCAMRRCRLTCRCKEHTAICLSSKHQV